MSGVPDSVLPDGLMPVSVTVRYFAAARAAAGSDFETLTVSPGVTVAELVGQLSYRGHELAQVLNRCSYLCDGVAVRDPQMTVSAGQTIDVLPPFAGG
jgi:molybdopterin synthase sulfur carrier subunit